MVGRCIKVEIISIRGRRLRTIARLMGIQKAFEQFGNSMVHLVIIPKVDVMANYGILVAEANAKIMFRK